MTLEQALLNRGDDADTVSETIQYMVDSVIEGRDPEEVLYEEGLEPDYVFDLLELLM